ncbi:MAG: alpha/beta hydrolase [Paracoccaceae bacterium]
MERPRSLPPDPSREFTIIDPEIYATKKALIDRLNDTLRRQPADERDLLFFVHGYNTSTTDAALMLAQFAHDSGFKGIPVLFSWASAGQTAKYVYDLNSALIAREKVAEVGALLSQTNANGYDLFAHSMGTLLTMEGLVQRASAGRLNEAGRLKNLVLASPDIDLDLFRSQLRQLGQNKPDNFFVLISADDRALRFSRLIAGGVPRVGAANTEELAELGVVVVDLTDVDDKTSLNQSKFVSSPEIVQILGQGLNRVGQFQLDNENGILRTLLLGASAEVVF